MGVKHAVATAHRNIACTNTQWRGNYCSDTKHKRAVKTSRFTHRQYEKTPFRSETAKRPQLRILKVTDCSSISDVVKQ